MDTNIDDLKHIRSMMERSSKFLSLSGMSGISAGIIALLGAGAAHYIIQHKVQITGIVLYDLFLAAIAVVILAGSLGIYFSLRKAKKSGSKFWMPVTLQILKDFGVPMVIGGLFCILLIYQNSTRMVASAMLIFYGLSLIAAGARTYRDIKILGVCEIILGVLAGIFVYNGLLFWAIGFGVMHILYGIIMYCKYDLKANKKN
jgi:hypothetical protein